MHIIIGVNIIGYSKNIYWQMRNLSRSFHKLKPLCTLRSLKSQVEGLQRFQRRGGVRRGSVRARVISTQYQAWVILIILVRQLPPQLCQQFYSIFIICFIIVSTYMYVIIYYTPWSAVITLFLYAGSDACAYYLLYVCQYVRMGYALRTQHDSQLAG